MTDGSKYGNDVNLIRIPVFYRDEMVARFANYSPSAGKPAEVVASWGKLGIPLKFVKPEPATEIELCLAHDEKYVHDILLCSIKNGFGNKLPVVAASLPYTVGSMISASREAISNGAVAVAPCSGFHHAGYKTCSGYCTFNGLVITACIVNTEGWSRLILKYGDFCKGLLENPDARLKYWEGHPSTDSKQSIRDLTDSQLIEGMRQACRAQPAEPSCHDPAMVRLMNRKSM